MSNWNPFVGGNRGFLEYKFKQPPETLVCRLLFVMSNSKDDKAHKRRSNARAAFRMCDDISSLLLRIVFRCSIWQRVDKLCLRFYSLSLYLSHSHTIHFGYINMRLKEIIIVSIYSQQNYMIMRGSVHAVVGGACWGITRLWSATVKPKFYCTCYAFQFELYICGREFLIARKRHQSCHPPTTI